MVFLLLGAGEVCPSCHDLSLDKAVGIYHPTYSLGALTERLATTAVGRRLASTLLFVGDQVALFFATFGGKSGAKATHRISGRRADFTDLSRLRLPLLTQGREVVVGLPYLSFLP